MITNVPVEIGSTVKFKTWGRSHAEITSKVIGVLPDTFFGKIAKYTISLDKPHPEIKSGETYRFHPWTYVKTDKDGNPVMDESGNPKFIQPQGFLDEDIIDVL